MSLIYIDDSFLILFIYSFLRPGHKSSCTQVSRSSEASQAREGNSSSINITPVLALKAAEAPATAVLPKFNKAVCGFCGEAKEKLLLCSRCKSVRYCHADHQRKHWSVLIAYVLVLI